ncbi:MAG: AMP-binding protein [Albidovulum sp.]|nr:AMP-binding protein [Albidovulum sp.]MDE0532373.1 AMP-binding protein [Albidovulum sp.]
MKQAERDSSLPNSEFCKSRGRFRWHSKSKVRSANGDACDSHVVGNLVSAPSDQECSKTAIIGDSNSVLALAQVFDAIRQERPFGLIPAGHHAGLRSRSLRDLHIAGESGDRNVFMCLSSGSQGSPKWICRTHESWLRSFEVNAELWNISTDSEFAILGLLGYSLSLYGALEALHNGADLLLLGGFRPDFQLSELSKRRVTHIFATPTQLRLLANAHRKGGEKALNSVLYVLVGGAKLDIATSEISSRIFSNAEVLEFYGTSETSFVATASKFSPSGSVGQPYPRTEIEIRDNRDVPVPFGTEGEIWVRSPYLFLGYSHGDSDATRWDNSGFLTVGEIGFQDSQGNLYIVGRKDRMVTVADQNVHPELIEDFLLEFEGIENAAAVPIEDPVRGHKFVAFVYGRNSNSNCEILLKSSRVKFGPLVSPRMIIGLSRWPLLQSGKTDYHFLNRLAAGEEI